jgi:hypothetical protein
MKATAFTIDGKTIGFIAREVARTDNVEEQCNGCLFEGRSSETCYAACKLATEAGQPDCDDHGSIYIYVVADPRQLVLPVEGV